MSEEVRRGEEEKKRWRREQRELCLVEVARAANLQSDPLFEFFAWPCLQTVRMAAETKPAFSTTKAPVSCISAQCTQTLERTGRWSDYSQGRGDVKGKSGRRLRS